MSHAPGMRKAVFEGAASEAWELFADAPAVQLALVGERGAPILRTVNAVVVDGAIAFHGAPAGEKMEGLGGRAVVATDRAVATIPSYFLDPERACPATTYYVSAQAHGVVREVVDLDAKARVLAALMAKYQPERGHAPISATNALYTKAIAGLLVAEVRPERVACKVKLGQNRRPEDRLRVLEGLWRRGHAGDAAAIATILARSPELPAPSFLRAPDGLRLQCDLAGAELDEATRLLEGAYWLEGVPRETVRAAVAASPARVGARDARGALVAFARATSDGRVAWLYDVVVRADARGRGIGRAVVALLLDHPAVRAALMVRLGTRDAMGFYERLGFRDVRAVARRPYPTTEMARAQR